LTESTARCTQCGATNRLRPARGNELPQCGRCQAPLPWLVAADESTFDREIKAPVPVLVDFWAPWCPPCRTIAPILDDLSAQLAGRLKIVKVDVDKAQSLALRYGASSIPLLVLIKEGQTVDQIRGAVPKATLLRSLEKHLPPPVQVA
jgi:thioredoxin 2